MKRFDVSDFLVVVGILGFLTSLGFWAGWPQAGTAAGLISVAVGLAVDKQRNRDGKS